MIRVFGIGSPFGDDQVGWKVIELLKQQLFIRQLSSDFLQLECCDRPGIRLIEMMRNANSVFLIDAMKSGAAPGTLKRYQNAEIDSSHGYLSTHGIGITETLQLGRALNDLPKQIILYGIEIGEITSETNLSVAVEQAAINLAPCLANELEETYYTHYPNKQTKRSDQYTHTTN